MRDYIAGWPQWFITNRAFFRSDDCQGLRHETGDNYAKIMGRHSPWFMQALRAAQDCDPDVQKPILMLYLKAKIEALASLSIYQDNFKKEDESKSAPEFRYWIEQKIASSAQDNPPEPFLFSACANAYEHVFSFLFKMINQFRLTYERMPGQDEFDSLTRQLASKLFKEALLSRRENAFFEAQFSNTENFFSFTRMADGYFRLISISHRQSKGLPCRKNWRTPCLQKKGLRRK